MRPIDHFGSRRVIFSGRSQAPVPARACSADGLSAVGDLRNMSSQRPAGHDHGKATADAIQP